MVYEKTATIMKIIISWSLLCFVSICLQKGYGILCYHCHQTSKECNNGAVDSIHQKNCTEDRCAVMKYETPMPGRKVLATLRDCASYTENEFVHQVSPDIRNPAKIILFQECSSPLCNGAKTKRFSIAFSIITFLCIYLLS